MKHRTIFKSRKAINFYKQVSFFLVALFLAIATCCQVIVPGDKFSKTLGKNFSIQVVPAVTGNYADVIITCNEQAMITHTLTAADSIYAVNSKWGLATVKGMIKLKPGKGTQLTILSADLQMNDSLGSISFAGDVAGWRRSGNDQPVLSYDLGTVCTVKTIITGENSDIATVNLYYVNTLIYTVTLTPVTPSATTSDSLIIGSLLINKGARLSMTVPSRFQKGGVMLRCVIKSDDHNPASFSALVASWNLNP
jgi:hypothetical protein